MCGGRRATGSVGLVVLGEAVEVGRVAVAHWRGRLMRRRVAGGGRREVVVVMGR